MFMGNFCRRNVELGLRVEEQATPGLRGKCPKSLRNVVLLLHNIKRSTYTLIPEPLIR